ncbi:MAG: hypothetical protein JSU63_11635 [Phycisphaerales bacterium]|nr:MAG: hypothetical protein JSU63_11635 [Phycisphaerales bacterium]
MCPYKVFLATGLCAFLTTVVLGQTPDSPNGVGPDTIVDGAHPDGRTSGLVEDGESAQPEPDWDGIEIDQQSQGTIHPDTESADLSHNQVDDVVGGAYAPDLPPSRLIIAQLDILPGIHPNVWDPQSTKALYVAIAGAEFFDILKVDPLSLALARVDRVGSDVRPMQADEPQLADVTGSPDEASTPVDRPHPDGIPDLLLRFDARMTVHALHLWKVGPNTPVDLVLHGNLLGGTAFEARDCLAAEELQPYSSHRKRAQRTTTERN